MAVAKQQSVVIEMPSAWLEANKKHSKGLKFPKTLGGIADALFILRAKRLIAQGLVDQMHTDQSALEAHAFELLQKDEAVKATGKVGQISRGEDFVPVVTDWDKFYGHIKKTGEFGLLNRAPNRAAFKERWAAKKSVPGTSSFGKVKINISAAPGKK